MSSGLYRRQPHLEQIDCSDDWWEVINTEVEVDGEFSSGYPIVALAETETMALHIQLIPEMKEALAELLRVAEAQLDRSPTVYGLTNCNALAKARCVLRNLKVLE